MLFVFISVFCLLSAHAGAHTQGSIGSSWDHLKLPPPAAVNSTPEQNTSSSQAQALNYAKGPAEQERSGRHAVCSQLPPNLEVRTSCRSKDQQHQREREQERGSVNDSHSDSHSQWLDVAKAARVFLLGVFCGVLPVTAMLHFIDYVAAPLLVHHGLAERVMPKHTAQPWHVVLYTVAIALFAQTLPIITVASLLHGQLLWRVSYSWELQPFSLLWWVFAVLLFQDGWEYWVHRWQHSSRWLYNKLHRNHHDRSVGTGALTVLFSSCLELVILMTVPHMLCMAMYILLIARDMGTGWIHISLWQVLTPIVAAAQIAGWEHSGLRFNSRLVYAVLNPFALTMQLCGTQMAPDEHLIHHKHPKYQLALYFHHWDVWCGTAFPSVQNNPAVRAACSPLQMLRNLAFYAALTLLVSKLVSMLIWS